MLDGVFERFAFVLDGHVVVAIFALAGFGAADDLRRNSEGFALGDDALCSFWIAIDLHAVPHIVDAEHLLVGRAAGLLDRLEDWGNRQEVIFDNVDASAETEALRLAPTRAVHHAVDRFAVFFEQLLDDWRVGAGRAHQCITDCE